MWLWASFMDTFKTSSCDCICDCDCNFESDGTCDCEPGRGGILTVTATVTVTETVAVTATVTVTVTVSYVERDCQVILLLKSGCFMLQSHSKPSFRCCKEGSTFCWKLCKQICDGIFHTSWIWANFGGSFSWFNNVANGIISQVSLCARE